MGKAHIELNLGCFTAIVALAFTLAWGLFTSPANAWAREAETLTSASTTEQVQGLAKSKVKTIETTQENTWVKAGKKIYSWDFYVKKAKNGSLRLRETPARFVSGTLSGLSNSNPKVIKVKHVKKHSYLLYTIGKPGKSTTKFTDTYDEWDTDSGTKTGYTIKDKVTVKHTVVKYENPIKLFKVGSVDYAAKFASDPQYNVKRAISGKVKVKAAAGWKLVKIRKVNNTVFSTEWGDQTTVKNGGKVSIGKGKGVLEVICYNKAAKYYSSVILMPGLKTFNIVYGG